MKMRFMMIPTPTVSELPESAAAALKLPCSKDEDNPANDYPDEEYSDATTTDSDWNLPGYFVAHSGRYVN